MLCAVPGPIRTYPRVFHIRSTSAILVRLVRPGLTSVMATTQLCQIKTCGIIVIGDEILKAQVQDTNSRFLCKQLRDYGIRVAKISVIPDEVRTIANEIRTFSEANDYVITTGGIGPTHDDVTYESLALALASPLALHPQLLAFWTQFYPLRNSSAAAPDPSEAAYKFSNCPAAAEVIFTQPQNSFASRFPVLHAANVFVFPGTPSIVEKCFPQLLGKHIVSENQFHTYALLLNVDEVLIVDQLNSCVSRNPSVIFGSYPLGGNQTKITLEARTPTELAEARSCLVASMTPLVDTVGTIRNNESLGFAQHSLEVIEQCLDSYSLDSCFLSFNGGKDCTLLLHLVHAMMKHKGFAAHRLLAVYFKLEDSFPEVEQFVQDTVERYNLELVQMQGSMKQGLSQLLKERPQLRAVFMGSRRGDPRCHSLTELTKTDNGWPEIMRVNPLLDWSYQNVWRTIREFHIPYCTLYDQGYSSLGSVHNTTRNPALVQVNPDGTESYLPPDSLHDDLSEREGRH